MDAFRQEQAVWLEGGLAVTMDHCDKRFCIIEQALTHLLPGPPNSTKPAQTTSPTATATTTSTSSTEPAPATRRATLEHSSEADLKDHATARETTERSEFSEDGRREAHVPPFAAGKHVELTGLKSSPELNGSEGILNEWLPDKGRWHVILEDGTDKLLKPENLADLRPEQPQQLDLQYRHEDDLFNEFLAWTAAIAEQGCPAECIPDFGGFLQAHGYAINE